jgi:putative phosphoribosyl transferase
LSRVVAPALLIVGGEDEPVIGMNREAFEQIRAQKKLEVVTGATHLFEEPGTLEEVARIAAAWFARYLGQRARSR